VIAAGAVVLGQAGISSQKLGFVASSAVQAAWARRRVARRRAKLAAFVVGAGFTLQILGGGAVCGKDKWIPGRPC
jgi:hypothetical protein